MKKLEVSLTQLAILLASVSAYALDNVDDAVPSMRQKFESMEDLINKKLDAIDDQTNEMLCAELIALHSTLTDALVNGN